MVEVPSPSLRFLTASAAVVLSAWLACAPGCRSAEETTDPSSASSSSSGTGGSVVLPDPEPLKVVNWNVRNFVNNVIDDTNAPMEETDPNYLLHRGNVGNVLRALDGDIVVLQEVEHEAVLTDLDDSELDGAYQEVHVVDANDPRGIDIGVLSKLPLDGIVTHKSDPFTKLGTQTPTYHYARDALEIHLTFNQRRLVLLGVHYRSKSAPDDPDKRLAEAQHTRAIADGITAADPETAVIILGDFNDTPASPAYDATVGTDPDVYRDVTLDLATGERWSYDFMGTLELVDQQMANPLMGSRLDAASVRIQHGPEVDAASDHSPVIATYDVN